MIIVRSSLFLPKTIPCLIICLHLSGRNPPKLFCTTSHRATPFLAHDYSLNDEEA